VGAVVLGAGTAVVLLRRSVHRVAASEPRLTEWVRSGFGIDALYCRVIVRPALAAATWVAERFDRRLVDGAIEGSVPASRWLGARINALQSGETEVYASLVGVGFVLLMGLVLWLGRG
jgi:NADH:ubiquinone oxidoreductase subunit 5 (subunit L)/multisubunit Na+/H+ antiporter MnhA subunit